ncbi:MAG: 16S rRNA (uracil(1498)-N(3))-methyltransferase [Ignavibacteriaceae bacterium]|nr:16S rRNA (uracil(1498)-N(3))-methyltransferase [Ignavibacteriaceae bacterium]
MNHHFSGIELFYAENYREGDTHITLSGSEYLHLIRVMRHSPGDEIHFTDGKGNFILSKFIRNGKNEGEFEIISRTFHPDKAGNLTFFIPILRNPDRMEFALEKAVELGITNFVFFKADKSVKQNLNLKRLESIALAAMKQSIRFHKPHISFADKLTEKLCEGKMTALLDQDAVTSVTSMTEISREVCFIFGPEGGLSERESGLFRGSLKLNLSDHRLRAETAVVTTASVISQML